MVHLLHLPQKAAHEGNTALTGGDYSVPGYIVPEVYFQLQTGIFQVLQRLFDFRSSTAEEVKQYRCYTSGTAL